MKKSIYREIEPRDLGGGLNAAEPQDRIADNQSPDMKNLWYKEGALVKRPGQRPAVANLGGSVHNISAVFDGFCVVHAGTRFYRWDEAGAKYYKGEFSPASGRYPASPEEGSVYIAADSGTIDGDHYEKGDRAIYYPAYAQTGTARVRGSVSAAGTAVVTVTAKSVEGSPLVITAALEAGDAAETAAEKIRRALRDSSALAGVFEAGGSGTQIILKRGARETYDETLNIGIKNGTCDGLEETAESYGRTMWHKEAKEIKPKEPGRAVADNKGAFVFFGGGLYYIDGNEIWSIYEDPADFEWKYAAVEPYAPAVLTGCAPDLSGGSEKEPYNLLGGRFTVKYNGNAGEGVCYYVAAVTSADTFKITRVRDSTVPMMFSNAGSSGWKVRKRGGNWRTGAVAATDGTITLSNHGFFVGDALEFTPGTGTLPEGVVVFDIDAVKVYKLPLGDEGLTDDIEVTVFDGVHPQGISLSRTADFTFDKETGTVDFSAGAYGTPPTGVENVLITACRAKSGERKRKITGCAAAVSFGGESGGSAGGARVFTGANPLYPQCYWRSDIAANGGHGISYFPETSEERLDQDAGAITAMAKMGAELIIFKENSIFAAGYSYDGRDAYFPVRECNGNTGCDIPGSVALIDNRLVFANTKDGVNMLISANGEQTVVKPLSANVNPLLLKETGLKNAVCCDFDRHYLLCVSGSAYLWDYGRTPYYNYSDYDKAQKRLSWYRWDGIRALCFFAGRSLYEGCEGGIAVFCNARDDFGKPYEAYFFSKAFDAGTPCEKKTFMYVYPVFKADGNIKAEVSVSDGKNGRHAARDFDAASFDWSGFAWDSFTWNVNKYADAVPIRLAMKKATHIQVKVSGTKAGRGVGLSGFRITYYENRG